MDLSQLLSLMVLMSSLMLFFRARRAGLAQRSAARVGLMLSLAAGAALWFASIWGSYVVLAAWGVTMLLPGLLIQRVQGAAQAQDFSRVARLMGILARFRPSAEDDNVRAIYRALALAQAGQLEQSLALLQQLRQMPGSTGARARAEMLRLTQRWEELLAMGFEADFDHHAAFDPTLALLWLRSLGECGKRGMLVSEWAHRAPRLSASGNQALLDAARLTLFAFTGQSAALGALIAQRLPLMPQDSVALWRATAALANGDTEAARQLVSAHLATPRHETRRALERRLSAPVATEPAAGEAELLRTEVQRLQHDIEYAETPSGLRTAAPFTRGLIVILVLVFALSFGRERAVSEAGAVSARAVMELGQWWRVLTYQFLHAGPMHLVMNLLGLDFLGREVERRMGSLRTAAIYFISGTMGGILFTLVHAGDVRGAPGLVGASGGIMGLVGATMAAYFRGHTLERSATASRRLRQAVTLVALQTVLDYLTPQLSMLAHLTGVVVGFLVTLPMTRTKPSAS